MNQRNRTKEEKVEDALDKIGDIEPSKRDEIKFTLMAADSNNVSAMSNMIRKLLGIKGRPINKYTDEYWVKRGWSKKPGNVKYERKNYSPLTKNYWIEKGFSEAEAEFKRKSCVPINPEYWVTRGYSHEEATKLASDQKVKNNNKGANKSKNRNEQERRAASPRTLEYWLLHYRGDEEKAKQALHKFQTNFSFEQCIERYGEEKGKEIFNDRQWRWQETLKQNNDMDELNAKKKTDLKQLHEKYQDIEQSVKHYNEHASRNRIQTSFNNIIDFLGSFEYRPVSSIFNKLNQSQWYYWGVETLEDCENFLKQHGIEYIKNDEYYVDGHGYYRYETEIGLLRSSSEYAFYKALCNNTSLDIVYEKLYNGKKTSRCDFFIPSKNLYIELSPKYHVLDEVKNVIDEKMTWGFPILVVTSAKHNDYPKIVADLKGGVYDNMHHPRRI